jgi:hypothetical protein
VSATLFDSSGAIVGKNTAGTPESKQMFRSIAVNKSIADGTWKLKLESKEPAETSILLAAFSDPNPLALEITAGKPNAAKQVGVQAKLTNNNSPVSGATVKAKVQSEDGKTFELTLLDDGVNGDGAASDGVYGAMTEKLADGGYLIEAQAETNGQIRLASASLTIGTSAVKQQVSKSKK